MKRFIKKILSLHFHDYGPFELSDDRKFMRRKCTRAGCDKVQEYKRHGKFPRL